MICLRLTYIQAICKGFPVQVQPVIVRTSIGVNTKPVAKQHTPPDHSAKEIPVRRLSSLSRQSRSGRSSVIPIDGQRKMALSVLSA